MGKEIKKINLIAHPFYGFVIRFEHPYGPVTFYEGQYYRYGLRGERIDPKRYAKRLADHWGKVIQETEKDAKSIAIIIRY